MLPDRVSNPGPLTYESGALPIALRGPYMFISAFHYIYLIGYGPQEMPRCWHVGVFGKLSTFCLTDREFNQSIFMEIPFVSFYKVADSVMQQIHNCPYKTQTATTATRPRLVASQYREIDAVLTSYA